MSDFGYGLHTDILGFSHIEEWVEEWVEAEYMGNLNLPEHGVLVSNGLRAGWYCTKSAKK